MIRIVESKYIISAVKASGYPATVLPEFAFVGRSNVGKSSMINTLTNRKLLAKIANKPGKTRLINFFETRYVKMDCHASLAMTNDVDCHASLAMTNVNNSEFILVDLPGYGYAKVSQSERDSWQKMINEYFQKRQQLTGVIVLVDIRHDPDPKDMTMIKMLRSLKINFLIAATKSDKIPVGKVVSSLNRFKTGFNLKDEPIYEFSSVKKTSMEKILKWIETNILNSVSLNKCVNHE